jgi:hypothetical protein
MRLFIHERVKFKLTDYGKKVLGDYLTKQTLDHGCNASACYKADSDEFITCPLIDFMNVFGSHKYVPLPLLVNNEFIIGE